MKFFLNLYALRDPIEKQNIGARGSVRMLLRAVLAMILICGVAFFVYFEAMLLREFKERTQKIVMRERLSNRQPHLLHIHLLETIYPLGSECFSKSQPSERFVRQANRCNNFSKQAFWPFLLAVSFALFIVTGPAALAQQTLFNVPSADVLDKGKVYGEFDFAFRWDANTGVYTPRLVTGIGHRIEVGLNLNGISAPGSAQTTLTPTVKWKAYDGGKNGWALLLGGDVFLPMQNKTYNAGTYVYGEFAKTLSPQTRLTFGACYFSPHVVSGGHEGGGQFGIEQPVGKRVTLAADWFTGDHAAGYVAPGAIIKLSSKLNAYTAYEVGNSGVSQGNHLLLMEIGWNFN
jgi:hypothetical protein